MRGSACQRRFWLALLLCLAAPVAAGTDFQIDHRHSHADFSVRMLWVHTIEGRFNRIDGRVLLVKSRSPGFPDAIVEATVKVDSLTADSERLRKRILAPRFFDGAHYSAIHFVSAAFDAREVVRGGALPGRLTLRGVTRPVVFQLTPTVCALRADTPCQIQVQGTVQRHRYGMTGHSATVSDAVKLRLVIDLLPM